MSHFDDDAITGAATEEATDGNEQASGAAARLAARLAMLDEQASPELLSASDQEAAQEEKSMSGNELPDAKAAFADKGGSQRDRLAEVVKADTESKRGEVSAATIGRMLGLVTQSEFSVLEGKVDLVLTRLSTVLAKLERVATMVNAQPLGSDLERIDAQIAALRSLLKEALADQTRKEEESRKQADRLLRAVKTGGRSEEPQP